MPNKHLVGTTTVLCRPSHSSMGLADPWEGAQLEAGAREGLSLRCRVQRRACLPDSWVVMVSAMQEHPQGPMKGRVRNVARTRYISLLLPLLQMTTNLAV